MHADHAVLVIYDNGFSFRISQMRDIESGIN